MPHAHCPMTAGASTERQSLQRGEPAQRAASETSARHCLPNAQFSIPQCPIKQSVNLVLSFLWFLYFTLDNNATNPVPEISP
ncbi:hypothetical protein [Tolypothrix sp. VBCCA 56010]|uniref:hypothetical protein n=1 Tax=Tolypothrix sp. VBCCA 56010 TaxID=3137731 RepID=UPI003D7C7AC0